MSALVPADELDRSPRAAEEEAEEQRLVAEERPLALPLQAEELQSLREMFLC